MKLKVHYTFRKSARFLTVKRVLYWHILMAMYWEQSGSCAHATDNPKYR
jgi:hypothetical protein